MARALPVGVYTAPSKKNPYEAKVFLGGKLKSVGYFKTPEEAAYRRKLYKDGHHWEGMQDGPYFGFTYIITNKKTGKKYVGKKQFFLWNGPTAGFKCHDLESEWWDIKAWKKNNWEMYTGSSDDLNAEIAEGNVWDYTYEVLEMCKTKLDLHLSEIKHMMMWDVLEAMDENGEYKYYNKNIASLEFRPPFKKAEVKDALAISEEAMRNYYLKPEHCAKCGKVIPYGLSCCKEEKGVFNDLRS